MGEEAAAAGDADPHDLRVQFWQAFIDATADVTPEGLGQYLTALVAEKNAHYPDDDAELLACGVLGLCTALEGTTGHAPTMAVRMKAMTLVLMRHFVGWSGPQ